MSAGAVRATLVSLSLGALLALSGCGGFEQRTIKMRTALDAGDVHGAIDALDKELKVDSPNDLPKELVGDNALLVLNRATIQQADVKFALSKRDFEAADKAIDMLDLSKNAGDTLVEFAFSASSSRYVAPPFEKLMINTLNMLNYLETSDLNGGKVEARRLSVMQRYLKDHTEDGDNPMLALGGYLAGTIYEQSGDHEEALRYYDETLRFRRLSQLREPVRKLKQTSSYSSPHIDALVSSAPAAAPPSATDGELLLVVGYGRVPHKIPKRIPIGLALTLFADHISPGDRAAANELALQGLVTWVNYPTLAESPGGYDSPTVVVDGRSVVFEEVADISAAVRAAWEKLEGRIVGSAISRMVARLVVGKGVQAATKDSIAGLLLSLGTQATLTALDTPDTRSWETLPARVVVARVRIPAGRHRVVLSARGATREGEVQVPSQGFATVSLMALR